MKFNRNLVALSLATAFSAGVSASDIIVATPFTVPAENVDAASYTIDLDSAVNTPNGNALGTRISWDASFGLNTGDILTFTFSNSLFMDGDVVLIAEEAAGGQPNAGVTDIDNDGDTNDVVEVAANFGSVDTTNGVTSVQVRINNGLILPTGIRLVLQSGPGSTEQDDNGLIDDETNNPMISIPMGASGNVSIASTGVTAGGTPIPAAIATAMTIVDIERQITGSISMPATSTIEISAASTSRTQFVEEGGAGDVLTTNNDTDLTQSSATYTFNNDADSSVEDFFVLNANDAMGVTLTGTNLGNLSTAVGAQFNSNNSGSRY